MYEYKVVTERDKRSAGGFEADTPESTLSSYAGEGWRVADGAVAANLMKSARAEFVMVLERAAQ